MRKTIKKWGDSLVVVFNSEERKVYDIEQGDIVDIEMNLIKRTKVKNGNTRIHRTI